MSRLRMEDNWESLDVDDSDLPSLTLRPCALISPRLIPGPAGKIQSAMNRKRLHHSHSESPVAAAQCSDDDADFKTNAWLHALHFSQSPQTSKDVVIPTTPLASIHNSSPHGIVDQVVAIINSCTPNGLGDMTVTLKDRTGIRDATIHQKVLSDTEFAKDISVKSAIILRKISIFAPLSKTVYLNITRSNVVKVFRKDVAPLSGNTHAVAPRVSYLPSDISKKSRILEDTLAQEQGIRNEETMHEVCQVATAGQSWLLNNQKKNGLSFPASSTNKISRDKINGTQNEALWDRQYSAATDNYEETGVVSGDNQVNLDSSEKRPTSDNLSEGHESSVFAGNLNGDRGDEIQQADKAVQQRSISKVSLPQWTDEQLLELFNDDDDDPLF